MENTSSTFNNQLIEACSKFIQALYNAKTRSISYEEFLENKDLNIQYMKWKKAVEKSLPVDIQWPLTLTELTYTVGITVWETDIVQDVFFRDFVRSLQSMFEQLSITEWIASIPIERSFEKFPVFTDFGPFAIVNARAENPKSEEDLFKTFQNILTIHWNVNFMNPVEVHESYIDLAHHFYENKSDCYIPGRPQLVLKVGRGDSARNESAMKERLRQFLPLLTICQIFVELEQGLLFRPAWVTMPDGKTRMRHGLIEIPNGAMAINKFTGHAELWRTEHESFESRDTQRYDVEKFINAWEKIAQPILNLKNVGLFGRLREAIDNALKLVATSRFYKLDMSNLFLNSVIATETVLNPFNVVGETAERFALMVAALTEKSSENRKNTYNIAKQLYRYRCHAVHRAKFDSDNDTVKIKEEQKTAFLLFLDCLSVIVQWASKRLANEQLCDKEAFEELFLDSLFKDQN